MSRLSHEAEEPVGLNRIRRTRGGDLLFEFAQGADVKDFRNKVAKILDSGCQPKRLTPRTEVEIFDIEPTEDKESILRAIRNCTNTDEASVSCPRLRRNRDGTTIALIRCDADVGKTLLEKRVIKISWTRCRVKKAPDILRCYRCHGFGHISRNCSFKLEVCWKCGTEGHGFGQCVADKPRCRLCSEKKLERTDHVAGAYNCPILLAAIEKSKKAAEGPTRTKRRPTHTHNAHTSN